MDHSTVRASAHHYDAFVSYRRADGQAFAHWLRKALQNYRLPKGVSGRQHPLHVYIDTSYERANENFWKNNIEPALQSSIYLIVILTRTSTLARGDGTQNWLEREIEFFCRLPQGKNVLVVTPSTEYAVNLPANLRKQFPYISVVVFESFSLNRLSPRRFFSLRQNLLTLIASLYQIQDADMPVLRQEEIWRKRQALWIYSAVACLVISLSILVSYVILAQRNERVRLENRARAVRTLNAQQQFVTQLRLAVTNLDNEARLRKLAETRNELQVLQAPFNLRLEEASRQLEQLLARLKVFISNSPENWQVLHDRLVEFFDLTKDMRKYSLSGLEVRRAVDSELNRLEALFMNQLEELP